MFGSACRLRRTWLLLVLSLAPRRRRIAQRSCQPVELIYLAERLRRLLDLCGRSGCVWPAERRRARRDEYERDVPNCSKIALLPTPVVLLQSQKKSRREIRAPMRVKQNGFRLSSASARPTAARSCARQSIPRAAVTSTLRRSRREERLRPSRVKFRVNAKIDLAQFSAFAGPPTAVDHGALRLQEGGREGHLR